MKNKLQLLTIFLLSATMTVGCSGQKEESKSGSQVKSVSADPVEPSGEEKAASESLLVTFIELGSVKCIPCKMMQPIMDDIIQEYAGQVKVVFHDVWTEEGQPYGQEYRIRAIPTQIFLDKDGNEYFRHEGFFPKEDLVKVLKQKGVQ